MNPGAVAFYDGVVYINLSEIKPMIAMPFHPSNTFTIEELNANLEDILHETEEKGRKQLSGDVTFKLTDTNDNVYEVKGSYDRQMMLGAYLVSLSIEDDMTNGYYLKEDI